MTALAMAQADGFECFALSVDYGQRHRSELDAAKRVSDAAGCAAEKFCRWTCVPSVAQP